MSVAGWSDYQETVGYALPKERLLAYLLPDLFGNPTHHTYYDLTTREVRPTDHTRANGEARTDTEWGGKNYVEGTVYLGVLPLLLAVIAILARPRGGALVLTIMAAVSLLLAFGTPLYALLFYGIPGVNQLHTPFRWVYPFTVCAAVLAGLGASRLGNSGSPLPLPQPPPPCVGEGEMFEVSSPLPRTGEGLGEGAPRSAYLRGTVGVLALGILAAAYLSPDWAVSLATRAIRRWPELRNGFGSPEMLMSYQWANAARAAALLAASGLVVWFAARRRFRFAGQLAVGLLIVDLFTFGVGFNAAADTRPSRSSPSPSPPSRPIPGCSASSPSAKTTRCPRTPTCCSGFRIFAGTTRSSCASMSSIWS